MINTSAAQIIIKPVFPVSIKIPPMYLWIFGLSSAAVRQQEKDRLSDGDFHIR